MIIGLFLIFLSFLSSPSLFLDKIPSLEEFYNKVKSVRGIIGVISFFWGLYKAFFLFKYFTFPRFILSAVMALIGFLLGFQWITENLFSNSLQAKEKARMYYQKLLPFEGSLGVTALVIGIIRIFKAF